MDQAQLLKQLCQGHGRHRGAGLPRSRTPPPRSQALGLVPHCFRPHHGLSHWPSTGPQVAQLLGSLLQRRHLPRCCCGSVAAARRRHGTQQPRHPHPGVTPQAPGPQRPQHDLGTSISAEAAGPTSVLRLQLTPGTTRETDAGLRALWGRGGASWERAVSEQGRQDET